MNVQMCATSHMVPGKLPVMLFIVMNDWMEYFRLLEWIPFYKPTPVSQAPCNDR